VFGIAAGAAEGGYNTLNGGPSGTTTPACSPWWRGFA